MLQQASNTARWRLDSLTASFVPQVVPLPVVEEEGLSPVEEDPLILEEQLLPLYKLSEPICLPIRSSAMYECPTVHQTVCTPLTPFGRYHSVLFFIAYTRVEFYVEILDRLKVYVPVIELPLKSLDVSLFTSVLIRTVLNKTFFVLFFHASF